VDQNLEVFFLFIFVSDRCVAKPIVGHVQAIRSRAVLLGHRDLRVRDGRSEGRQSTPGDGGHVVRRFPARLHPAGRDADIGPVTRLVLRSSVHAQCVPHQNIRQPFHHSHRNAP